MYAKETQVGERLRCPDCFTMVEIKAPKVGPPPTKKKTLDELEEFQLSDPGERPAYKPMVEARGDYEELKLLDTKAPPRKEPTPPGATSTPVRSSETVDPMFHERLLPGPLAGPLLTHPTTAMAHVEDDLDDQEVVLSAPVERLEVKTEIKVPNIPPPPKDERKEPTWNDDEWGFVSDPRAAGAWKKSPFYVGIFSIFVDPQILLRVAAYSIGFSVVLALLARAADLSDPAHSQTFTAIFTFLASGLLGFLVLASFSPVLLAIASDTANGDEKVQSWPDWNVGEWILSALYVPFAGILAALPGVLMACLFFAVGPEARWFAPFPPLITFLAIFPVLFSSMLTESSLFYLVSGKVLRSFRSHGDGWVTFYILSFFVFLFACLGTAIAEGGVLLGGLGLFMTSLFSAILFVLLLVLYVRLLGRLMWYTQTVRRKEYEQ